MPSATECFAAVCAPGTVKILGVRIRPLTLGHVVLLSRIGNSLAVGGVESFDDLVSGVQILSRDWRDGCSLLDRPRSTIKLRGWQLLCRLRNGIATGDFTPLAYAPKQWRLLKIWFRNQTDLNNWPTFASKSDKVGNSTSTPSEALILAGMMAEFSMTFDQVMNTPYALCRTMLAVNAERHGAGLCCWTDSTDHEHKKEYLREYENSWREKHGLKPLDYSGN